MRTFASPTAHVMAQSTNTTSEFSFFDHLEELRSRLFKSVAGLVVGCAATAFWARDILDNVLLKPAIDSGIKLQNIEPFGQAFLILKVVFIVGGIAASPWILFQVWSFVAPGLYENERRWAGTITFFTTLCFLAGLAFGYFWLIPSMMEYIKAVSDVNITDNITVTYYFGFFVNMLLACGLMFELPMVTWVLSRIGVVSPSLLSKYRRHSVVAIVIVAAIITPSPDPVTQIMVAIPLYILFEISVVLSRIAYKQRAAVA
jgi:sec-independent protein translocase protein TatC